MVMEFTLEEIVGLLQGPLNDEDLYAVCEKMCVAVLTLDQTQCRNITITRDTVLLGAEGNIKIDIGTGIIGIYRYFRLSRAAKSYFLIGLSEDCEQHCFFFQLQVKISCQDFYLEVFD